MDTVNWADFMGNNRTEIIRFCVRTRSWDHDKTVLIIQVPIIDLSFIIII